MQTAQASILGTAWLGSSWPNTGALRAGPALQSPQPIRVNLMTWLLVAPGAPPAAYPIPKLGAAPGHWVHGGEVAQAAGQRPPRSLSPAAPAGQGALQCLPLPLPLSLLCPGQVGQALTERAGLLSRTCPGGCSLSPTVCLSAPGTKTKDSVRMFLTEGRWRPWDRDLARGPSG